MMIWFALLIFSCSYGSETQRNNDLYQVDYRERFQTKLAIPGLSSWDITASFETRYRPKKLKQKKVLISDQASTLGEN